MLPVVFDLDGTLINSLPNITDAANALLAEEGLPPVTQKVTAGFVGHGERVFLDRLIAATALKASAFDALMPRFIAHYKVAARETQLMPKAAETVAAFRNRGVKTGLCTNKPRAPLLPTLAAAGLDDAFDIVVAGDDLEKRKPDPAPLWHAIERLGAESCIYVGDSEVDAETAQRAGVPFALYTEGIRVREIADIPHDAVFSDFDDLAAVYRKLSPRG